MQLTAGEALSVAFAYAMLEYDPLGLLPVARDRVFAELDDGVVVEED
jgi:hypothetical protein